MLRFLAVAIVLAFACPADATIYVSKSGNDSNSGTSWAQAKLTIQAAVNVAANQHQVWVAKGVYFEHLVVPSTTKLYGGFAGGETLATQSNPVLNETVIDGQNSGPCITASESPSFDGFTIQNGYATSGGAAIDASYNWFKINRCRIINNSASGDGRIIYIRSRFDMTNCIVKNNYGPSGEYIIVHTNPDGGSLVSYNLIVNNSGGVSLSPGAYCDHNTIAYNTGPSLRAVGLVVSGDALITIKYNIIAFNGSGVLVEGNQKRWPPIGEISALIFSENFVYGNGTGPQLSGTGDISNVFEIDPLFINPAGGDFNISPASPAIDTDFQKDAGSLEQPNPVPAKSVYVRSNGSDLGDGLSWATAKATVNAGIAMCNHRDILNVAAGEYNENVVLDKRLAWFYGGFEGDLVNGFTNTGYTARTVIDANGMGRGVTYTGFGSINLSRLHIKNGVGDIGAGVMSTQALALFQVDVTDCNATSDGGAVFANGDLSIGNGRFQRNSTAQGGCIIKLNGMLSLHRSIIAQNQGTVLGGLFETPEISSCTIADNNGVIAPQLSDYNAFKYCLLATTQNDYKQSTQSIWEVPTIGIIPPWYYSVLNHGFKNRTEGDYRLTILSKAVDFQGDRGRPDVDGNNPNGETDCGPHEFYPDTVRDSLYVRVGNKVRIRNVVVTGAFSDGFNVQDIGSFTGMRVIKSNPNVSTGDLVDIDATVTNLPSNGEKVLSSATLAIKGSATVNPVNVRLLHIGGWFPDLTTDWLFGVSKPDGIPANNSSPPAVVYGPSNTGLFVRVNGVVTHVGEGFYYLDQGINIDDGSGYSGVRIEGDPATVNVGDLVVVTGTSSRILINSKPQRLVREVSRVVN